MELTKETSLFKKDAIKTDVVAAAATATNYIEDVSGSNQTGMTLQPASNSADNYMQLDATEIGIYQNGHKIASYGNIITLYRLVNDNPVKTLEITGTGLQLYGSSTINADVSLTSAGLVLGKGGIEAGTPGSNNFIYLSTEGYPLKNSNVTPIIAGLTINNFTPTAAQTDGRTIDDMPWRQVIGTKFGVTSDGTLYANGAHITGQITIDGHSDSLSTEMASLQTATDDAATKATNFLTNLSGIDGLIVRKDASSNNDYVNIQANAIRMVTGGKEAFKTWVEDNTTKVQIGLASAWHMIIANNQIRFMRNASTELGHIGYESNDGHMFVGNEYTYNDAHYLGGLFSSYALGRIESYKDYVSDPGTKVSFSRVSCGQSSMTLEIQNELTPYTYPNYTSTKPQASIYLSSLNNLADYCYINLRAPREINFITPNIYFKPFDIGATQYGSYAHIYLQNIPGGSTGSYIMKNSEGYLTTGNASSSKRYKHDILPITSQELDPHQLYNIEVIQFIYNDDRLEQKDQRFRKKVPGFIAEDVYKYYPIAVDLKDGRPEDWNHRFILPPMLKLIQEQHQEIEELKTKISILEEKIL